MDYTVSVSHGINFDQGLVAPKADLDFTGAMAHDLEIVAGRVLLTIRRAGRTTEDFASGSLVQALDRVQSVMATRGFVQQRDIDSSNGKLRVGDRKLRVERADLEFQPIIGDRVLMEGKVYEVVGPDDMTLGTAWILWCRS